METRNKLYKSQTDKALFGVCGGLAQYFNVDSLVVRLLFVLFTLLYGAGLLFYLIAALVIPTEPVSTGLQPFAAGAAPGTPEGPSAVHPAEYLAADGTHYENRASGSPQEENPAAEAPPVLSSPPAPANPQPQPSQERRRDSGKSLGLALIVLGGLILVKVFFPWVDGRAIVGAGMVLAGLVFIVRKA